MTMYMDVQNHLLGSSPAPFLLHTHLWASHGKDT